MGNHKINLWRKGKIRTPSATYIELFLLPLILKATAQHRGSRYCNCHKTTSSFGKTLSRPTLSIAVSLGYTKIPFVHIQISWYSCRYHTPTIPTGEYASQPNTSLTLSNHWWRHIPLANRAAIIHDITEWHLGIKTPSYDLQACHPCMLFICDRWIT